MLKKILIVFGTRPEIIKLAPLIKVLKNSPLKNQFLIVSTSQHEELLDEQLNFWEITPDYFLTMSPQKGNLTRLLTHTISGLQDILDQVNSIEYIIVQGDTNTALACANLSFLNKIKLIHIEAGLRSFNLNDPFPEEFNRIIASRAAYFHFAPTEISKTNLIKEGIESSKIMVIGNTVIDALNFVKNKDAEISSKNKVIITLHRRENIDSNYLILIGLIKDLAKKYSDLEFIWITHPNCESKIKSHISSLPNIKVLQHLPYQEFVNLYYTSKLIITDSGGVSEEAIHLGLPTIIFRQRTERIEPIGENFPMIVSLDKNQLSNFFDEQINSFNKITFSYGDGFASQKIVNWLNKEINQLNYDILIVGGGPAGTGFLLKALKDGNSSTLFNNKIALVERTSDLISGNLTNFKVNSDTFSSVFLECLEGETGNAIDLNKIKNEIEFVKSFNGRSIPLEKLKNYFKMLGQLIKEYLEKKEKCDFYLNSTVTKIEQKENNNYEVFIEGKTKTITTKNIIICTGGKPVSLTKENTNFSKSVSLDKFIDKCIHSDTILKSNNVQDLIHLKQNNAKVVILGGSHSAFSVAHLLLNKLSNNITHDGSIKIWCSSLPKIYFNTKQEAIDNSYNDFTDSDICPVTKKLFRLAGLRMDGRELYMQILALGNLEREKRVSVQVYTNQTQLLEKDLEEATVIILAYGYKFNMFPFIDANGNEIRFKGEETKHWVNDYCELIDYKNNIVPNVYASGLATGFIPSGELGGEPSFEGQTNGIWYYQNAIADRIINKINCENTTNLP